METLYEFNKKKERWSVRGRYDHSSGSFKVLRVTSHHDDCVTGREDETGTNRSYVAYG
jgi:hypothetical protein